MPWVESACPQGLLDVTLKFTDPPTAHTQVVGDKAHRSGADDEYHVCNELVEAQLRVRLHRAWAVSSDQLQQDFDESGSAGGTENACDTPSTSPITVIKSVTEASSQRTGRGDKLGVGDGSKVLSLALSQARAEAQQRRAAATVVCGSLYLVGEFLRLLGGETQPRRTTHDREHG